MLKVWESIICHLHHLFLAAIPVGIQYLVLKVWGLGIEYSCSSLGVSDQSFVPAKGLGFGGNSPVLSMAFESRVSCLGIRVQYMGFGLSGSLSQDLWFVVEMLVSRV